MTFSSFWTSLVAIGGFATQLQPTQAACSPLELVIARGTTEPPDPTYGIIVGDPLFRATQALLPNITGYAVNYPATLDCDSRSLGINDTVNHLYNQSIACPKQQFVLVGYSQGADVMHYAAERIHPHFYPRITALVMFGDPGHRGPGGIDPLGGSTIVFPWKLVFKLRENCAPGDCVCTNNGTNIAAHLSYDNPGTTYINDSAIYIQKQWYKHGFAGPEPASNPGCQTPENVAALSSLGALLGGTTGLPTCGGSTATPTATSCSTSISATTPARVTAAPSMKGSSP